MGFLGSLGGLVGGLAGNALLPGIGGAIGTALGSSLGGSSGGGGGGGSSTSGDGSAGGQNNAYIPTQRAQTDTNFISNKDQYQQAINAQYGVTNPYNQQLLQGQFNNPYYAYAQQSANASASDLSRLGQGAASLGARGYENSNNQYNDALRQSQLLSNILPQSQVATQGLYDQAVTSNQQYQNLMNYQQGQLGNIEQSQGNLYGAGNQVLQLSMDPQNALYNRTAQQLTDQTRAAEYARGIQTSPLGASIEANALGNFNIDWQNQQLARQAQGLSSAQGAYGSAQGFGNSYTNAQAGLQAGQNQQYSGLNAAAQQNALNYVGAVGAANSQAQQNISAANQGFFNAGNQGAQAAYGAGQAGLGVYQQGYGYQNQALQNYQGLNQGYLQGLNQLQSNDLGYLNFGQGAQNQAFNQSAYNNQQQQNAIGQISGPIGQALGNTNWGNVGNTVAGWFGGSPASTPTAPPSDYQWGSDITSGYGGTT
jgi:hypothetical protein